MISIVDLALVHVGAVANDGSMRFEDIIAAGESEAVMAQLDADSCCGLFVRGLLRAWCEQNGIAPPPVLRPPYVTSTVLTRLLALAHRADAVAPAHGAVAELGDIWWYGPTPAIRSEHVELDVGDGWRVASGEKIGGRQAIVCVTRSGQDVELAPAQPAIALPLRPVVCLVRWSAMRSYLESGGA